MESLKIYIDRLRHEHKVVIQETLPPQFMDVNEEGLQFKAPITVSAECYLAEDHLVIHLSVSTTALLPCAICNELVEHPIKIKNLYSTIPLDDIKGAIFDLTQEIRDQVLLQLPLFTECSQGECPERIAMKKFLKPAPESPIEPEHFPFKNL